MDRTTDGRADERTDLTTPWEDGRNYADDTSWAEIAYQNIIGMLQIKP